MGALNKAFTIKFNVLNILLFMEFVSENYSNKLCYSDENQVGMKGFFTFGFTD